MILHGEREQKWLRQSAMTFRRVGFSSVRVAGVRRSQVSLLRKRFRVTRKFEKWQLKQGWDILDGLSQANDIRTSGVVARRRRWGRWGETRGGLGAVNSAMCHSRHSLRLLCCSEATLLLLHLADSRTCRLSPLFAAVTNTLCASTVSRRRIRGGKKKRKKSRSKKEDRKPVEKFSWNGLTARGNFLPLSFSFRIFFVAIIFTPFCFRFFFFFFTV